MAATKQYRIEINGIQQSISEIDALIAKAEQLGRTLQGGVTLAVKGDASAVVEAQANITAEIAKQNDALKEQKSIIQGTTGDYAEALGVATSILGTYEENLKKLAEYDAKLKEIAATKKDYEKSGASADDMAELLAAEMKYRQLKSETLSVIKTETKLIQAETGSYDQMNATVVRLRDALRTSGGNLTAEQFSSISSAVDDLDKKLKDADKGMGQFFRNVGNYPSAFEGFSKITVEIGGVTREFEGLKPAILEIKNAMGQLAVNGRTDTEEYAKLAEQMRDLQLAMATVNDEMNRSKDASSGLHDVIEMMQGFVAIGEIGQGFSQLFGIDDSALGEQIRKMTTLMGILQGLNELKNQLATGTGIGPALQKVMDVSGLSDSMKNVSTYAKELGERLHLVKPAAESAAGGMTTFGVATRFAAESVKMFWRALLVGIVIEGVMLIIDGLVEGIKWLYTAIHDWISLSDDAERSNKAMAESFDQLKDSVEGFNAARDREVKSGALQQYDAEYEKLVNINKQLEKQAGLLKENIGLAAQDADITPKLGDYTRLSQEIENINRLKAQGKEETSAWGEVYSDVLADVVARMETLDITDEKALNNFIQWAKESPQVQSAITWAINSSDESMQRLGNSISNGVSNMYELVNAAFAVQSSINQINMKLREELELREKYGKNWQLEQRVLNSNREVDNSGLSEEQKQKLKADREAEIRETTQHGRKVNAVKKKTANESLNIERQMQQDKLAIMRDGLTKTLTTIEYERRRRLEEIAKMNTSEAKKSEARNLANQRYDKEAADARKKWREDYLKAEKEFQQNLDRQERELQKQELNYRKSDTAFSRNRTISGLDKKYAEAFLKPFYDQLRTIGSLESELKKKSAELADELSDLLDKAGKLKGQIANTSDDDALEPLTKEYEALNKQIEIRNDLLSNNISRMAEIQASSAEMEAEIAKSENRLVADNISARFEKWEEYYREVFDFKVAWGKKDIDYEKQLNEIELDNQLDALATELEAQRKALNERYEILLNDERAIEESGKTKTELKKEYDDGLFRLDLVYRSRMTELIDANNQKNAELERQYVEDVKKGRSDMYTSIINELNKYYAALDKQQSKLKNDNTDQWGFLNITQFRKQREQLITDFEDLINGSIKPKMEKLREELAAGKISLGDFTNAYSELEQLKEKALETLGEIRGDNGMEDFMKGVDEWVQQIGQAVNQILSAIFDYRNSQFDKMREDLDKQIELVQQKYDEMEELAQRHKDAMNEIEDELTTARGDRRQHLIDALNDEIDAQRRALAEQQKAERQKQKLEADGDKLELERKKEQKRQSLITAIINAALAVSSAAANKWPIPAIPLMAMAAAVGAAQVASIQKQHYANGGVLQGPSHAQGGIKVGPNIEVEGGEFVTNKKTTAKNIDLLNYINSKRKRIGMDDMMEFFATGGGQPLFGVKGKFADGGMLPSLEVANRVAEVVVARDDRDIVVSVVDINDAQQRVAKVREWAGLDGR